MKSGWSTIIVMASVALAAVATLAFSSGAHAAEDGEPGQSMRPDWQHHGGMHHHNPAGMLGMLMFGPLDLSVQQQHAVVDVVAKHKADVMQKREAVHKSMKAMMEAMHQESPDPKAISSAYDQASAARKQMLLARLQVRQEIMAILTPEQKAKIKEWHDQRMQGMHGSTDTQEDQGEFMSADMDVE
jgi:periplasmic protein CpxP/Spy